MLGELLLLELVVLEGQGSGLVQSGTQPLLATMLNPPLFILVVVMFLLASILQFSGKRQTIVRPLALLCTYRAVR